MSNFFTNLLQKFIENRDIRKFKKNILYYLFFRLIRKKLTSNLKVKIYDFFIWASYKNNKQSHSILRKCDFEDFQELKFIEKINKKKKILLFDCGANFGFYSLYVCSRSSQNKVYSFEASPSTFKDLKKNIILNNFNNIELFNLALSDKENQELQFLESKNDWESSLLNLNFWVENKIKIKTDILDNFTEKNLIVKNDFYTIIKLDVEGHEMSVLKGSSKLIKEFSPLIIIEFSKFIKNEDYEIMDSFIKSNDYAIYDSKYNLINFEIVKDRLKKLPDNMYGIGNNFLIKKNSDFENIIKII